MFKRLIGFGVACALAVGLAATSEARVGAWKEGRVLFVSEGNFSHDNSTTASLFTASTLSRYQPNDGDVIVMEAFAAIGTVDNEGATLTIGSSLGGTDMLTSVAIMGDGRLHVRAVGVVRSLGTSGTILWTIETHMQTDTDVDNIVNTTILSVDTTADSVDWSIRDQDLGLSFDWTVASSANTLDVEQFIVSVH